MKCSNCSEIVKPVVAIDIDGTLGNYHEHFLKFASMYLGITLDNLPPYEGQRGFKEWFLQTFQTDETMWNQIKLAYRQGAQKRSMPVYPGTFDLIDVLREEGAEVWLTTTRPYLRLDGVDPDTRFWLASVAYVSYDGLLYDEDKYKVLAERVDKGRVVAVLDDLPEQFDAATKVFGEGIPILRKTKYNRLISRSWSVNSLGQALERILPRVRNWHGYQR